MANWIEYTEPKWRELDMDKLGIDEAYLRTISSSNKTNWLYTLNKACYKCPYTKFFEISPQKVHHGKIEIARGISLKIFDRDVGVYAFENETAICTMDQDMGEFGVYNISIADNQTCTFSTDKEPVNIYLPLLLILLILAVLIAIFSVSKYLYKKFRRFSVDDENADETEIDQNKKVPVKKRMKSIDTFRGIAIILMIFVNTGGGGYWWIEHASWNGLHIADFVFPWFLWIMGVCMPISVRSQLNRNIPKRVILQNIVWRSIKLFLIGVCLNSISGPKLEELRIMGILQRFGIANLVVGSFYTMFATNDFILPLERFKRMFADIFLIKFVWIVAVALIAMYAGLVFDLEVPGCPRGYLGPGGMHDMGAHKDCIGGASGYIDKLILGESHMYQYPGAKKIYQSSAFDPEGLLGCLLTILQTIFGLQCGSTILLFGEWKSRVKRWLIWSVTLGLLAGILCLFSQEEGWIPINKDLMSLSFVLATSATAFFVQTICYILIDVKSIWNGHPFLQCGMNAILLYVGHSVFHKMLPWHWTTGLMNTHFMQLLKSTWTTVLWVLIAIYLYKKKFFYAL